MPGMAVLIAESAAKSYRQLTGAAVRPRRKGAVMTIRKTWPASLLAVVPALALLAGCGKKPPAPPGSGVVPPPITDPVKDGTKPVPNKDGNTIPDFPKVETPPA